MMTFLPLQLLLLLIRPVACVLVGSVLLPHGDFAYDPSLVLNPESNTNKPEDIKRYFVASKIASASRYAGQWLMDFARPDIVFLSTPHGIKLDNDFGIYMSSTGRGTAEIGNDLYDNSNRTYNVSLEVPMAPDLAADLLVTLKGSSPSSRNYNHENVSGIYSYDDSMPMPLNWGEIIPLLFLPGLTLQNKKVIIWSMPERRYLHGSQMVSELLRLGGKLAAWANNRPERIAVVVSGDLSHTHESQGPYGYSNTSGPFDDAVGEWASDPCRNADLLLKVATKLQSKAMSCGYTGYVLWHGFMMCHQHQNRTKYRSTLLVDDNVTYFGMMSAIFDPITVVDDVVEEGILS